MPKITPFLWFDNNLDEAVEFYTSVFKTVKVNYINRAPGSSPGDKSQAFSASFEIDGQTFYALNGGPGHPFTDAVSFFVNCNTQEEIDYFWEHLTAGGGKEGRCGWLKDKFGLSWQIVPPILGTLLSGPDPAKSQRALQAMMKMNKLDIVGLKAAYEGE